LETALANQVIITQLPVPTNISIAHNAVSHVCWDNFDINEETPSGSGTTHTTHGIIVQEVVSNSSSENITNISVPKSKQRGFHLVPPSLPFCLSRKRVEPSFEVSTSAVTNSSSIHLTSQNTVQFLWVLSRLMMKDSLTVPEWSGWISRISDDGTTTVQSNIGYMAPILHPITEYATVQQCLMTSLEVSKCLNQKYTFVTMDLAAAKIAYDIIWDSKDKCSTVVLNLGPFHIMCSYMGALGKMMAGSGFEDVLIQSGLCASGSIDQVMSGKHYNRAIRVHQRMLEAVERMLMEAFTHTHSSTGMSTFIEKMSMLPDYPNAESFSCTLSDNDFVDLSDQYEDFKNKVRQGQLGKTAQFWVSYCDCVWTLLRFQLAVKMNDLSLFIRSLREMCGILFSSNHLNYAKYLPLYYTLLMNLDSTHPGASTLLRMN
jgi:hypothetical protein